MKDRFMRFIRSARKNTTGRLTEAERETYRYCLDRMTEEVPDLTDREISEIFSYIERSMGFYLTLCAQRLQPQKTYEGCMENLLFLVEYLLHYYYPKVRKSNLTRLYDLAVHVERFHPKDPAELIEYEIRTGLLEKIHFCIDYYFA